MVTPPRMNLSMTEVMIVMTGKLQSTFTLMPKILVMTVCTTVLLEHYREL